MIVTEIRYNPLKDNTPVSQTGWIDLYKAYETHTIPSVIEEDEVAYNEIEDPASILGKPGDIFEAQRMMHYVNSVGEKKEGESDVTGA